MINLAYALDDDRLIEKIEQLETENKKLKEAIKALIDNYSHVLWNDVELKWKNITKIMINWKEYDLWCKIEF